MLNDALGVRLLIATPRGGDSAITVTYSSMTVIELDRGADGVALQLLARPPVNALDLNLVRAIDSEVTSAIESGALALVQILARREHPLGGDESQI
jgi:hypothetical protein